MFYLCTEIKNKMSTEKINYNEHCLYFTVNSLARAINEMTDRAFSKTGISASYGHLMLIVIDQPNLSLGELSKKMNLKPSTMTRFIDKLENLDYVKRELTGRTVKVSATQNGEKLRPQIINALKTLYENYCEVLGKDFAIKLTEDTHKANEILHD